MKQEGSHPIIDAWAQPALADSLKKLPEVARLFKQSGSWTDEMIGVAWRHENVYSDTSAYLPRYYPPQLIHYLKTYGKEKVLFGTNFPQLSLEKCVLQVKELGLSDEVAARFLFQNARRVFNLA